MKRIRWLVEAGLVVCLLAPIAVLPLSVALRLGDLLGLATYYAWGSRRRIAVRNIEDSAAAGAFVLSEPAPVVARKSLMNLGRSFVEIIKIYFGQGRSIIDGIEIRGVEHFLRAKEKGKGIILITGHCGNWELSALCFGARVDPFAVVARAQNNPYLHGLVERARARYGNRVIYKQGALKAILSELRQNRVVGILMDQAVFPEEGFVVDFLGRGAWTTKMPALIARKTGATVLPAFVHREGGHQVGVFLPEVTLSENPDPEQALRDDTQRFSRPIEEYIKAHPDEWLWIHRRWKRVS